MTTKNVLPRIAKGKKPIYLDERAIDNLMAMVLTLTQELSVLRDRLDTIEQLIEKMVFLRRKILRIFNRNRTVKISDLKEEVVSWIESSCRSKKIWNQIYSR